MSHENIWGKSFQIEGRSQCKGCKMRTCLMSSGTTKEASTPGVQESKGKSHEIIELTVVSSCRAFVGHWVEGCVEQRRDT